MGRAPISTAVRALRQVGVAVRRGIDCRRRLRIDRHENDIRLEQSRVDRVPALSAVHAFVNTRLGPGIKGGGRLRVNRQGVNLANPAGQASAGYAPARTAVRTLE